MDAGYTGKKIADLRRQMGWTQKQLAEQLHVTDKAVSKWERGLNFPDLSMMEPLGALLGITVPELLVIEQRTQQETIAVVTDISGKEKEKLKRTFRYRAWILIVIGVILLISQTWASYLFAQQSMYGLPQVLTAGMSGLSGLIIGNAIYILIHYRKL